MFGRQINTYTSYGHYKKLTKLTTRGQMLPIYSAVEKRKPLNGYRSKGVAGLGIPRKRYVNDNNIIGLVSYDGNAVFVSCTREITRHRHLVIIFVLVFII